MDVELLRSIFDYNPYTGLFTWKYHPTRPSLIGTQAGGVTGSGIDLCYKRKRYKAHRVGWAFEYGDPGDLLIDHKDQNPFNNKLVNLRLATNLQNSWNSSQPAGSTGVKGVSFTKDKYRARLRIGSERLELGYYDSLEEAAQVIRKAREFHHGEFANHL